MTLSGTGVAAPVVSGLPATLTFTSQPLGIAVGRADRYAHELWQRFPDCQQYQCGRRYRRRRTPVRSSVAAGATCTISVTFTPAAEGSRSGTLSITDNNDGIAGSTQTVTLSGTGAGPLASIPTSPLAFTGQIVGTTSSAQSVTLTNSGNAAMTITSIAASGDFGGERTPAERAWRRAGIAPSV